jgi:predicted AlkP superfamily pyrophosphatase or phosphodiesterase
MLSIDGLSAAALADSTVALPSLRGLISRGAHARRLTPVFPSVTWPCHTSIVTGVSPARHGVLGNMVFDRASHSEVEHFSAAFVMAGPGVRAGAKLDAISMLDLGPTAARILGLDLPDAEGKPLVEALADAPAH